MIDRTAIAIDARAELVRRAWTLTGNPHDAEDIVQDAYERVLPKLDAIEPAAAIPAVLWVAARNRWYDLKRRDRVVQFAPLPERWTGINPAEPDEAGQVPDLLLTESTEAVVLELLDWLRVQDVLPLLPDRHRALLIAVYWLDEPVGTNNTRKTHIHRARAAFRKQWEAAA